eukprot:2050806-Amphidinium_carterae.1
MTGRAQVRHLVIAKTIILDAIALRSIACAPTLRRHVDISAVMPPGHRWNMRFLPHQTKYNRADTIAQ